MATFAMKVFIGTLFGILTLPYDRLQKMISINFFIVRQEQI